MHMYMYMYMYIYIDTHVICSSNTSAGGHADASIAKSGGRQARSRSDPDAHEVDVT